MKTKTLLIAAAALAAGVVTSQAQVYSQNVVGYVNLTTPAVNQFACFANPLDNGTNNLTSLFPSAPNQTVVEVWNGVSFQSAIKAFGSWDTNLVVAPGTGFFIKYPSSAGIVTNTFVGTVLNENPSTSGGGTNITSLPTTFVLLGSKFPIAGNLTASGTNTLNLGPVLANQSVVEVWNGTSFQSAIKAFGSWDTNLDLSVGQGFFVKSKNATNWVQTLVP